MDTPIVDKNIIDSLASSLTEFLERVTPLSKGSLLDACADGIMFLGLLVIAWLVYQIFHLIIARSLTSFFKKTENTWDDELIKSRIIKRIARLIPVFILWKWTPEILSSHYASNLARGAFSILLIIIGLSVLFSALNTFHRLYQRQKISKEVPITGIIQTGKIILTIGAGILILSVLLGKSPGLIFSGFGALTAILMLVFKDPILGLAAGIQLSSNRLIAVGDWIEVPKYNADGKVLEMGLTTVKVENWDKTVTTIPTYSLISESFKNWQAMSESGIRRIKRNLSLDLHTVRFLTPQEKEQLQHNPLLKDAVAEALEAETNVGIFRAYAESYLKKHGEISPAGHRLVRQLQPTPEGLPLEIYCFSENNDWLHYEGLQADIIDHFLSVLPLFHLKVFQGASGEDVRQALSLKNS